MKTYTVIGVYEDTGERTADVLEAESPEAAEALVYQERDHEGFLIAAVLAGLVSPEA